MKKNLFLLSVLSITLYSRAQDTTRLSGKLNLAAAAILDSVYDDDQGPRLKIDTIQKKYGAGSPQMDSLWKVMGRKDSIDLVKVKKIVQQYGWLGPDEVGGKASLAIFLVIQHADSLTQVTYLPVMREAVKKGKARAVHLALLEDRVLCDQGKPQLYGSQVRTNKQGKSELFPIADEPNVDKRRAAIGLEPLEVYAKYFGIDYHLPAAKSSASDKRWP